MSMQEAVLAHMDAEQAGSILVRNSGGYVARFTITYKVKDKDFSKHSGNFTIGVNKSETIPVGATGINLKVEEMWGFGWSTIFTKDFPEPVTKCYEVYGTTLNPKHKSMDC